MLKTITKFVLRRRRGVRQPREQIAEEADSSDAQSDSEAPPQIAEPKPQEPSAPTAYGTVKWYDPGKRYGFVALSDGSGDAFLHATALAGIGITTLLPGATLALRVAAGQRGPQVTEVISVDSSTAAQPRVSRTRIRPLPHRQALQASVQEMGTVKWYNATKGFGFIVLDRGGKDVFVHSSVLERAGITRLSEGLRVFVGVTEGQKGPEAASIEVVSRA